MSNYDKEKEQDSCAWLGRFLSDEPSMANSIPDHHEEPVCNDPELSFPSKETLFSGGLEQPLDLSPFLTNSEEGLPPESIPNRHQEPTANGPYLRFPDEEKVFSDKLTLSDVDKGLRRQTVKRNLKEIADQLTRHYTFTSFRTDLAVYLPPRWRILNRETQGEFLSSEIAKLYPEDSEYLGIWDYQEIFFHLKNSPCIKHLNQIPAPDCRYLYCKDCVYDRREKRCTPHSEEFFNFYTLNLRAEEIGQSEGGYWENFLEDLTGSDDRLRQRILEMIGVIITGYPSKSFFLLHGESGTGKSQLSNFLRNLLGNDVCFALNDISQLGERWTTGSLLGKLLCICGDVPNVPLTSKAIGTIKQLTGDDLIRGEFKYQNAFTFENTAKLLFVSNYLLQIPNVEMERALLERLVTVPCRYPIPQDRQILHLHEHLLREAGYIVELALEALDDLIDRNGAFTLIAEDKGEPFFQRPEKEQKVMSFVHNCCLYEEDAACPVGELFAAFQDYTPESTPDVTQFSKHLMKAFPEIKPYRTKSTRGYQGIRLKE